MTETKAELMAAIQKEWDNLQSSLDGLTKSKCICLGCRRLVDQGCARPYHGLAGAADHVDVQSREGLTLTRWSQARRSIASTGSGISK